MKKSGFYGMMLLSAAVLLMAGCTEDLLDGRRGEVPIYLTATVSEGNGHAGTRAGVDIQSTQLPSGATFTAEFSDNVTPSSVTYTADGNGGITTTTQPCFTLSGTSTTVHAYAPSKPAGTTFSVQADQSTDANYKASDLMYASVSIWKLNPVGALTFSHKMAKVIVNATLGDGISSISAVKIVGGYRTINITDATTCTLGSTLSDANSTSGTYITAYSGTHSAGTLSCAALLPPQTVTGAFLVITTDQGDVTYTLDSKAFATSQSYTFNVTVNAAAVGSSIDITDWANNGNATVNPTVETGGLKAIDLGLSVKWANMNVGASSPTDYGMYFMWGDVAGHPGVTTDGFSFEWANYKWGTSSSSLTKYTSSDGKTTLEAADDAATANWGGKWRMPTQTEMQELVDTKSNTTNYTWTWCDGSSVKYNNTTVKGWKIESKKSGTAGNHIFLPAAGSRGNTNVSYQGSDCYYWSSTLYSGRPRDAFYLYFDSYDAYVLGSNRYYGCTVRPVYDPYPRASSATSDDVGKIICSNGHIHATVSAVDCGGTASGIIAYVGDVGTADKSSGSSSYKGLALALYDYGGSLTTDGTTCQWYTDDSGNCIPNGQSSTVATAIGSDGDWGKGIDNTNRLATAACGSGHTHAAAQNAKNFSVARPSGASQWFLPTMYQWNLMVKAMCGKSTDLTTYINNDYAADKFNEKITAAGGRGVLSDRYWSSVEYGTGAWYMAFSGGGAGGSAKSKVSMVRAVFAF